MSPHSAVALARPPAGLPAPAKATCFVVGPFGKPDSKARAWSDCLYDLLKVALRDRFDIQRSIDDPTASNITEKMQEQLGAATMVIGDLSDLNANAFYEVGFRHGRAMPFVLVCRSGTDIPFDLSTYAVTFIDATYEETSRKYYVGDFGKATAALQARVEAACNEPAPPRFFEKSGYLVRVFTWTTTYSSSIATDWLDAQPDAVRRQIDDYENGVSRGPVDAKLRVSMAEYLSLKGAASKLWEGDIFYFLNASTRELAMGYAVYQFPTGPIVIPLRGKDRREDCAEIVFDQPERQVSVGDLQVTLPRYKFTVRFHRDTDSGTLRGQILHPTTRTLVGEAELAPKWGFQPDN